MQPPLRLEVYWRQVPSEEGPAASVFHAQEETLRIDLFGERPHIHYHHAEARPLEGGEHRAYLPPGDIDELIARAVHEVATNLPYSLGLDRRRRVRAMELDPATLATAARKMGEEMRELVARHG